MRAPFINSMIFPVLNIYCSRPIEYHLELMRLEYLKQISWDNLIHGHTQSFQVILYTFRAI